MYVRSCRGQENAASYIRASKKILQYMTKEERDKTIAIYRCLKDLSNFFVDLPNDWNPIWMEEEFRDEDDPEPDPWWEFLKESDFSTVQSAYPLRLEKEACEPAGDNCGASYLNVNFEKQLLERLEDEYYLDRNRKARTDIVRHLVPAFEDRDKRKKDISRNPTGRFRIHGLLGDEQRGLTGDNRRGFEENLLILYPNDYNAIFLPLLRRVGRLLREQIQAAINNGVYPEKVYLIGGFGAAPSFRSYLAAFLDQLRTEHKLDSEMKLVTTSDQESVSAVASGAVLRALDKNDGPARNPVASYGFLRREPYKFRPEYLEGHEESGRPERDEIDGEEYITAIDYFMKEAKQDCTLNVRSYIFDAITMIHAFDIEAEHLLCEEVLYVSDSTSKSHFSIDHECNRSAQVAGKIITDMTFLRDEGNILPEFPESDAYGEERGRPHFRIEYGIVPIVEGRNLRYEARYPSGRGGQALQTAQVSIAAAFVPGTK